MDNELTPEQVQAARARWNAIAELSVQITQGKAEQLTEFALMNMEHGAGVSLIASAQSREQPELRSYVVVCSGKYTDDDLARIKEFILSAAQDATTGFKSETKIDTFGQKGGSGNGTDQN